MQFDWPDWTPRQWLGIGLMGVSVVPIAYSLGWFDWLTQGAQPGNDLVAEPHAVQCAGHPFAADRGSILVRNLDGSPAANVTVFFQHRLGNEPPAKDRWTRVGVTNADGIGPQVAWSHWDSGWFFARDEQRSFDSNEVALCG